jgi:hypothetical protein
MRRYVFLAWLSLALSVAPAALAGPEDEIRARLCDTHRATVTDAEGHPLDIEVVEGGV